MKYLILAMCILFAGCAVVPHKPVNYRGEVSKYKPYVQLDSFRKRLLDCDNNMCTVLVFVEPWVHNPTNFHLSGQLTCTYTKKNSLGEEESDPVHSALQLPPNKSIREDMSTMFSIPNNEPTDITVGCLYRYRKDGTEHKSFKLSFNKTMKVNPVFWRSRKINVKAKRW